MKGARTGERWAQRQKAISQVLNEDSMYLYPSRTRYRRAPLGIERPDYCRGASDMIEVVGLTDGSSQYRQTEAVAYLCAEIWAVGVLLVGDGKHNSP